MGLITFDPSITLDDPLFARDTMVEILERRGYKYYVRKDGRLRWYEVDEDGPAYVRLADEVMTLLAELGTVNSVVKALGINKDTVLKSWDYWHEQNDGYCASAEEAVERNLAQHWCLYGGGSCRRRDEPALEVVRRTVLVTRVLHERSTA